MSRKPRAAESTGGRLMTTEEFILKAKEVHGDKYDYSATICTKGSTSRVTYRCSIHGEVDQLANGHLQGKGCGWCSGTRKLTTDMILAKFLEVHGDTYDYSLLVYKGINKKVDIICKEHGVFSQLAASHREGQGCPDCGIRKVKKANTSDTTSFVEKAKKIHGGLYSYGNTVYTSVTTPVRITCSKHGDYEQSPHSHLKGSGCCECAKETKSKKMSIFGGGWSYSDWAAAGEASTNFEGFSLYIIRCYGNGEEFIKVGKTFTSIPTRFKNSTLPYRYEVITQVYYNAFAISNLEKKIHSAIKDYSYRPKRSFSGVSECFSPDALESALAIARSP